MKQAFRYFIGVWIGGIVILLWTGLLVFNLQLEVDLSSPWTYALLLLQTHLFTGLFITAHDAMHGTVSPKHPRLNHFIGKLAAVLFIFNSYNKLRPKHYEHHRFAGTDKDPDFHNGNAGFVFWYLDFLKEYITIRQFILAAITYNVLQYGLGISQINLILFWIIPSFLSTFQLFYFGTYIPHRGMHAPDNRHHSRTQHKNHLWAFVSCYFFGYHYEHHDSPNTPWWGLWRLK